MAITATFQADFTSFSTAVDKAEVRLKSFEQGAGRVEKALSKMSDGLRGTKLIQDATLMAAAIEKAGGVSVLTEKEVRQLGDQSKTAAEKMQKLGLGVPEQLQKVINAANDLTEKEAAAAKAADDLKSAQKRAADEASRSKEAFSGMVGTLKSIGAAVGIGFGVQQLVGFAKAALDDADALVKLSDKTGISIAGLQRFQAAGDDAGNTVDEMSSAITALENNVAGGDKSAVAALERLQIDLTQFKNLSPENQFIAISDAIRQIKDPADQVNIAMDLFGKTGAAVLPTLKRGFDDLKGAAVGMSEETVRELDALGDDFNKLYRTVKGFAADAGLEIWHWAQGPLVTASNQIKAMREEVERMANAIKAAPKVGVGQLPSIPSDGAEAVEQAREIAELQQKLNERRREHEAATKRAEQAEKDFKKSIEDATIAMNLSVFTLHRFGATELPAVQTGIAGLDTTIDHLDSQTLADLKIRLQDVGHAGVEAFQDVKEEARGLDDVLQDSLGGLNDIFQSAFEGGGDIAGALKSYATQVGEGLLSMIPVVGPYISQFAGAIVSGLSKLFGNFGGPSQDELAGRDVVAQFESQFSSVEDMINRVGEAYVANGRSAEEAQRAIQRLWAAEREGAEVTEAALRDITAELERHNRVADAIHAAGFLSQDELKEAEELAHDVFDEMERSGQYTAEQLSQAYYNWQKAMADAGNAAAQAWIKAHDNVIAGASAAETAISDLQKQRDSLAQSIANEAPEDVMGVIEAQTRGQIAVLDAQIEQQRAALEKQAEDTAQAIEDALNDINPDDITVKVNWNMDDLPHDWYQGGERPEPLPGFATGTKGRFLDFGSGTPVMLHGKERVMTEGESSNQVSGDVILMVDGAELGRMARRDILRGGKAMKEFRTMVKAVA